ncbi:DJ-1/PfpI family protein [Obelidium mucronatum]|nr:DJ-1/PfpI family protein [Obelidium mucronatum]
MLSPITPRFGRKQPVAVVIGETKGGSEVTDFVVPYSILKRSNQFEVFSVGTESTVLKLVMGSFSIHTNHTIATFTAAFPDGADVVIVPNQINQKDALLVRWIQEQSGKGAKIVGVCEGVWSLAHAGLLKGKNATTHWFTRGSLGGAAGCKVVTGQRYVEDGAVVTTAGVTASIPVSLALVEAVAGTEIAKRVASDIGAREWAPEYDGSAYTLAKLVPRIIQSGLVWSKDILGIEIVEGIDELSLALIADVYNRTGKTKAVTFAHDVVLSKNGMSIVPEKPVLPVGGTLVEVGETPALELLNSSLARIIKNYGKSSAVRAAIEMEYPTEL